MKKTFTAKSVTGLSAIAREIIPQLTNTTVVAFYGKMGAGKTTFIKQICFELRVDDNVNSPSFSIINEYYSKDGRRIFHFDFYRLKNSEEIFDLGYEDYFYGDGICLIEWPEKIEGYLPDNRLNILIEELPDGTRQIEISEMIH